MSKIFGIMLFPDAEELDFVASPEVARKVQKFIEYYPEPPYAEAPIAVGKETS